MLEILKRKKCFEFLVIGNTLRDSKSCFFYQSLFKLSTIFFPMYIFFRDITFHFKNVAIKEKFYSCQFEEQYVIYYALKINPVLIERIKMNHYSLYLKVAQTVTQERELVMMGLVWLSLNSATSGSIVMMAVMKRSAVSISVLRCCYCIIPSRCSVNIEIKTIIL